MADSQTPPAVLSGEQGRHYPFIKQTIAACMIQTSPERRRALQHTPVQIPAWYAAASSAQKDQLKALMDARCESLNALESSLGKIQTVNAFCQPLLETALKDAGHALGVNRTWLRLYSPVDDAFGVRTGGFKSKTYSLLQAALNNFNVQEAQAGFFNAASGFITEPDARGHFERQATGLTIDAFANLCRTLDLGQRYQAYLNRLLYPGDTLSEGVLRERCLRFQKAAFLAAAFLALLKGDIHADDHALLLRVAAGESPIMLGAKQVWYRTPCLMHLHLQDCLIIDPCVKYHYSDWIIVYIPDDPEHPIKRYASFKDFEDELSQRLMAGARDMDRSAGTPVTDFQRFFSRFVAYKDRPYYFRRLTELVVDAPPQPFGAQWIRSEWGQLAQHVAAPFVPPLISIKGQPQPEIRVPARHPHFNINADALDGLWGDVDLWPHRYESLRRRLLADGCAQAISTADTDSAASARRLEHYLNIGLFGVNLLAMAIPPLGAVMALVMVGQMLYEVLDGVVDLSQGDREAGWAHLYDVLENLAQVAAGAAVFHFAASPFIESLKPVQLPSGKRRLWKPDLSGYRQTRPLPAVRSVDERGLHTVDGKHYLPLDGEHYALHHEPLLERYSIEHPTRPDAYRPRLVHNGSGAWNHEAEQPLSWEGVTLMRRLGPVVEGFSDARLEQIRQVSGVDEARLRRLHVEGEPVPGILLDTIRQFRAYDDAVRLSEGIGAGALSDRLCSYAASLAVELPGWPQGKAIEAYVGDRLSGPAVKYGAAQATGGDLLGVTRSDLMKGQLPARIVAFLDEAQLDTLVGSQTPREPVARALAVQKQLQARAQYCRSRIMRSLYVSQQPEADATVALVQRDFKGVPTLAVREILAEASPAELASLTQRQRVPLRLAEHVRRLQQQTRLIHAYEGLYLEELANRDTEAVVLNTLPRLPGWSDQLRLEVRDGGLEGELRASFGPVDARARKVLVRLAEGQYQAFDALGQELHGINGLYGALQHALTDAHRRAIGLPHVGQGGALKGLILDKLLPREQLRNVLGMQPERKPLFHWPRRLSNNRLGYPLSGRGEGGDPIKARLKKLYPLMNSVQMSDYLYSRRQDPAGWLEALETERFDLDTALNRWLVDGPTDRGSLRVRRKIYDVIRLAWEKGGEWDVDTRDHYRGQRIRLEGRTVGAQLATLPRLPGNFDHVSSIYLAECGLTDQGAGFLASFRRLRVLALDGNQLTRLPEACAQMRALEGLYLADNQIALTTETALQIRGMTRLISLSLEGNPLSTNVDISRMPRLRWLYLAGCGLSDWPTGVFARPRPRDFLLELSGNHLTSIPDVAPGSERAGIVARSVVTRDWLAPPVLETLKLYLESVGLDPERRFPPRGMLDSAHWKNGLAEQQWLSKQGVWNDLEEAAQSEPFFDEIRKLSESSDTRTPEYKVDLTAKVWRMLDAMVADTALRERLFQMASAPTTCVDAGAQLFNAMGVEVLLQEAQALPDANLMRLELLELAKGKARLDELGRIAHARIRELIEQGRRCPEHDEDGALIPQFDNLGNAVRSIDEVEIHLAYATGLAERLDLPWQSRSMMFREPDVTDRMLDEAYTRVRALERGDLLREGIVEQPFWADYVQVTYANEFDAVSAKNDALINLYTAQRELADDGGLTVQQKADLRLTIDTSAQVLGRSPEQASPDQVMSDEEYFADVASLGEERKNVLRAVTDRVMGRTPQNRK